jgi:putative endonuclease
VASSGKRLGNEGEQAACEFLQREGYRILARNYTCSAGELDIIAFRDNCIVFVEVKTRAEDDAADPEENITRSKQRQLERVARAWLARKGEPECTYRFDALSVVLPPDGEPRIRHIIDAFEPSR